MERKKERKKRGEGKILCSEKREEGQREREREMMMMLWYVHHILE